MENKQHLKGLHKHIYKYNKSITLYCYLHYEEAEEGAVEEGVKIEPDWPANMSLEYAYISEDSDIDVSVLLDNVLVGSIEKVALESYRD